MKILTLALTGSLGSGKSTALKCFGRLGAEVIDCDRIARELREAFPRGRVKQLIRNFGKEILTAQGEIDPRLLGRVVFSHIGKRRTLERLLHPAIMREVWKKLSVSRKPIRVVEIPLLFETKKERKFDASIAVWLPAKFIFKRLGQQGWSHREIRSRLASQMPLKMKCQKADFILDNSGSRQQICNQVRILYQACQAVVQ